MIDNTKRPSMSSSGGSNPVDRSLPNVLNLNPGRTSFALQGTGATPRENFPSSYSPSLGYSRLDCQPIETTKLIQIRGNTSYISTDEAPPELTVRAVLFSMVMSVVLGSANAYLGLLAGVTITASIPASVIAMGVIGLFPSRSILEMNIAQTGAAVGTSIMSGMIYTMPALIINGYISKLDIWETTAVAALGGFIGVLVSNPLRRVFVVEQNLLFPEGVAIAELLKAGQRTQTGSLKPVLWGSVVGGLFKFMSEGLRLWKSIAQAASYVGSSVVFMGLNCSPALSGVGFIIGIQNCLIFFAGGLLNWWFILPIYASIKGEGERNGDSAQDYAFELWSKETRFVGVGAVIVAGLHTLLSLRKRFVQLWTQGFRTYFNESREVNRTEKEMPVPWTLAGLVLCMFLSLPFFWYLSENGGIAFLLCIIIFITGTVFSSINAYIGGKIGSSNAPASGMTLASILVTALILSSIYSGKDKDELGPYLSILVGAVVCTAAALAADCQQDLKAGYMIGSTPYKLQIIQTIGMLPPIIMSPYIINLLVEVYGIKKDDDDDNDSKYSDPLPAPQASLMAAITKNVFDGNTPWSFVYIGMAFAIVILTIDHILEVTGKSKSRFPLLSTAIGIYIPIEVTAAIFLGGSINWIGGRFYTWKEKKATSTHELASIRETKAQGGKSGLLFCGGLITGEALMGILIAIPIVIADDKDLFSVNSGYVKEWPGVLAMVAILSSLLYVIIEKAD